MEILIYTLSVRLRMSVQARRGARSGTGSGRSASLLATQGMKYHDRPFFMGEAGTETGLAVLLAAHVARAAAGAQVSHFDGELARRRGSRGSA